jgi:hypothetical protein
VGAKTTASRKKTSQRAQRFRSKQVNIREEIERWSALKTAMGSPDDVVVVKTLIYL